jgi:hypothetical protein
MTHTTRRAGGSQRGRGGRYEVELPQGVTAADWGLERVRVQNPSIRCYLGCIRLLEEVLDGNYAVLHCSPDRVRKIWQQVEHVGRLMRSELLPTIEAPSVIPSVGEARRHAAASFRALADNALTPIEQYGHSFPAYQLPEARKLLCVSMGKIHAFLRDTFGEILANDPRSRHDADYFLSRRFAQDIEESEWLYSSVYELDDLAQGLDKVCSTELTALLPRMRRERTIPSEPEWERARTIVDSLVVDLLPKVKEVLGLRGVRIDDVELLEAQASAISADCRSLVEAHLVGREVIEQLKAGGGSTLEDWEKSAKDLITCQRVVSGRIIELFTRLQRSVRDLAKQVAAAKAGIEKRRALMLAKDHLEPSSESGRRVRRTR